MTTTQGRVRASDASIEDVTAAIQEAVALAIEERRRLGLSIFVWRDGKTLEIPADEIPPYTPLQT